MEIKKKSKEYKYSWRKDRIKTAINDSLKWIMKKIFKT